MKVLFIFSFLWGSNLFAQSYLTKGDLGDLLTCTKTCDFEYPLYSNDSEKLNLSEAHPEIERTISRHSKNIECKSVCNSIIEKRKLAKECSASCRFDIIYNGSKIIKTRKKITEDAARKCTVDCENSDNLKRKLNECLEQVRVNEENSTKGVNLLKRDMKKLQEDISDPSTTANTINK